MSSENESNLIQVNEYTIDLENQTMIGIHGAEFSFKWLADGGIVAYEYMGNGTNQAEIYFAGPNSHIVLEIKRIIFEREVLSEQNKQRQKEEAE